MIYKDPIYVTSQFIHIIALRESENFKKCFASFNSDFVDVIYKTGKYLDKNIYSHCERREAITTLAIASFHFVPFAMTLCNSFCFTT